MFKLVVLCAFFAAAAAKPGFIAAPYTQYATTYLAPASTTITKSASSIIHPSPLFYQSPLSYAHFIKKRSAQFPLTYSAPATYYPNFVSSYSSPLIHSASYLPATYSHFGSSPAVHLIKKRSAAFIPATYITPTTYSHTAYSTSPLLTSTYSAPFYTNSHLYSQPLAYTHLIKKRSAPLLNTYLAPGSYSHQSRFDLQTTHTPYSSISYASPFVYSSNLGYSHIY